MVDSYDKVLLSEIKKDLMIRSVDGEVNLDKYIWNRLCHRMSLTEDEEYDHRAEEEFWEKRDEEHNDEEDEDETDTIL